MIQMIKMQQEILEEKIIIKEFIEVNNVKN